MKKKYVDVLFISCAVVTMSTMLTGCGSSKLNVVNEKVTVEYGSEVSLEAGDYLDNKDKVLKAVEVESELEKIKGYPEVGEYTINFSYKKQNAEVMVSVVDTTKPKFVEFKDTVDTYQNAKVDFESLYTVEDLSEVEVVVDEANIDYSISGSYVATLTATDKYGNAEEKEVTVNVLPVELKLDNAYASVNVGSTVQLNATTNVEDCKVVYTSSNSGVATVDENGLVTGVAKGSATITAEVNGIKVECVVTVNAVKTTTSNSGSTNKNTNSGSTTNKGTTTNNSGSTTTNNGGSQTTTQQTATPKTSREAFNLINAERTKLGLQPAVWDAECERIALLRAAEIIKEATPTHNGFDKFQRENMALGECIAWGYPSASAVVNAWMNSSGHRDTLMRENRVYLAVVQIGSRWVAINSWSNQVEPW